MTATPSSVSFFFDPRCPWTWLTSRWLVDVAHRRDLTVYWRAFSLPLINSDEDDPAQVSELTDAGDRALAVIESLSAEGRHDDAGRFCTEIGKLTFLADAQLDNSLLDAAGLAAGLDHVSERADSDENSDRVRSAFEEIRALVGEDVGSPSLRFDDRGLAASGPIVNPVPSTASEADRIFDAVAELVATPSFCELKRSRGGGADLR